MRIYLPFILSLAVCSAVAAQAPLPIDKIVQYVGVEMQRQHIPNLSLGITFNDSMRYQWDFGAPSIKGNYQIGSLTKSFVAVAVLQLVEKGKIVLDTPVRAYLPWFGMADKKASGEITVRHLLNQTSGLSKSVGFLEPDAATDEAAEKIFADYLKDKSLISAPGKMFNYSNMNYKLLGRIVARAAGTTCGQYIQTNIFFPLEMGGSYAAYNKAHDLTLVPPHQYWFGFARAVAPPVYNDYSMPGYEIISNAEDMCRYLQTMLRDGKLLSGDSLLSAEHISLLLTPPFLQSDYGMGWFVRPDTPFTPNHSGLNKSYSSSMTFRPARQMGVIVLTNINNLDDAADAISRGVLQIIDGKTPAPSSLFNMYLRYFLLFALLIVFALLVKALIDWSEHRFRLKFTMAPMVWLWLALSAGYWLAALYYIPQYEEISLGSMWGFQPDLAFALCTLSGMGVLGALTRAFVRWNRRHTASLAAEDTDA